MTVYEEIQRMSKEDLAKWIVKLLHEGPEFCTEVHCRLLCKHRNADRKCDIPDEEDCPVVVENISNLEIINTLLDSESEV